MARIRSIKPTFWTDEKLAELAREARLTFIGLISAMADDYGRLRGSPRLVRGSVYPMDDDITARDVEAHLAQLEGAGVIRRYAVNGEQYIEIVNWAKHQKIDRPSDSLLPAFVERSSNDRRTISETSTSVRAGGEGIGEELGEEKNPVPSERVSGETQLPLVAVRDAPPGTAPRGAVLPAPERPTRRRRRAPPKPANGDGPHLRGDAGAEAADALARASPWGPGGWVAEAARRIALSIGRFPEGRVGKALSPVLADIGEEALFSAVDNFCLRGRSRFRARDPTPELFAQYYRDFLPLPVDQWGNPILSH